jgi:hypothetical protein
MRRVLLCCLTMLFCPFALALGQIPSLQPGQRVRVTAASYDFDRTLVTYLRTGSDTLYVDVLRRRLVRGRAVRDSLSVALPLATVSRLEVPVGRRRNWDKGARTGAIVGGGLGLLVGIGIATCDDPWFCSQTSGQSVTAVVSGTAVGGLVGSLFGAAVGALSSREAWREVPLGRARVAVHPTPNGVGLGVAFRF